LKTKEIHSQIYVVGGWQISKKQALELQGLIGHQKVPQKNIDKERIRRE
jgi:hypothetical protein